MKKFITIISSLLLLAMSLYAQQPTKLAGMGTLGGGSIFAINEDGTNPEKWMDLDSISGYLPGTNLTISNGRLWGLTNKGGSNGYGTIFNLDLDGTNYTKVHDFDSINGRWYYDLHDHGSRGSLMESNGKLWGMTSHGGSNDEGVIFNLDLNGTNFSKLHDFDSVMGRIPMGGLFESNSKLWGMTSSGGSSDYGVIFNLDLDGTGYIKVHDFDGYNGGTPKGSLVESNGKLWGTTYLGGAIFNLDLDGTGYTVVRNFLSDNIMQQPEGNLVESNGKLWGVTFGWDYDIHTRGTIFTISLDGSKYTEIHQFDGTNGERPYGSLVESNGKLWGMTELGGDNWDGGIIYSIDTTGSNFAKVYDFGTGTIGGMPRGSLTVIKESDFIVSVPTELAEISLQLYPNPVDNSFKLSEMGFKTQQVKIYNLNGRLVKQFEKDQVEYDVSNLTPGIYMIVIESPHNISYQKMVKK